MNIKYTTLLSIVTAASLLSGCAYKNPIHNKKQSLSYEVCDKVKANYDFKDFRNFPNRPMNFHSVFIPLGDISVIECGYINDTLDYISVNPRKSNMVKAVVDYGADGHFDKIYLNVGEQLPWGLPTEDLGFDLTKDLDKELELELKKYLEREE